MLFFEYIASPVQNKTHTIDHVLVFFFFSIKVVELLLPGKWEAEKRLKKLPKLRTFIRLYTKLYIVRDAGKGGYPTKLLQSVQRAIGIHLS